MYLTDYDGGFFMSDTGSINGPGWGYGPPDTVPLQEAQPYIKNTLILIDPMDPWQSENQRVQDQCQYMTGCSWPNGVTATMRAYALGVRTNIGYNFEFLSPWILNTQTRYVGSLSIFESMAAHEATTVMWATSIWNRDKGGNPTQGGNWVVQTPCFKDAAGNYLPPMNTITAPNVLESYPTGWSGSLSSWDIYGGVWPFYNQVDLSYLNPPTSNGLKDGFVVTGFADGHTKAMPLEQLTVGCNVYGGAGKGTVTNPSTFIWSLQ
jgi:hypothetical protein